MRIEPLLAKFKDDAYGRIARLYHSIPQSFRDKLETERYSIECFVKKAAREIPPGSLVLDAGGGMSPYKRFFGHCRYIAQDFCRGDTRWDYSEIDVNCDIKQLPFSDNIFDAIINTQVLEHTNEPAQVLKELYRVLRPGGKLYATVPQGWEEHQAPYDYFRYTRFGLEYLLDKVGFSTIFIEPRGGYFWYLGDRVSRLPSFLFPEVQNIFLDLLRSLIKLPVMILFKVILVLPCYYLDVLDHRKILTLGYACIAQK